MQRRAGVVVRVRLFASLREAFGTSEIDVILHENTFEYLIKELNKAVRSKDQVLDVDRLLVAVNEEIISHSKLRELKFKSGDLIDLMPLPSGG
ncbi:MAG: hypothetical protein DRN15_00125 [Thermoprotei archaeon]|nr:MAG: hypothetical protein DRN15_00125 [Thermoprotei archaeon]RLF25738.1 MAG: hypothetical protein DRM97_00765 [Thermoprotei archaeon]